MPTGRSSAWPASPTTCRRRGRRTRPTAGWRRWTRISASTTTSRSASPISTAIAGLSVAQLERHCKRIFQLTPRQMIHKARLGAASQLLAGDAPITEIALRCGYTDHSAFSRQFKALTGLSPSQYRETHRQPESVTPRPATGGGSNPAPFCNTAGRARAGRSGAAWHSDAPAKAVALQRRIFYRRRTRFWHSHCSLKISYTKSQMRDLPPSHSTASPEAP